MDAESIVGVGNIYASEALFLSGIRPTKRANTLSKAKCEQLVQAIKYVLAQSIKSGGTSFRDYVDTDQKPGLHQLHLKVYGRENQNCHTCSHIIKKITQSGRSSYYCPQCQK